MHTFLLLLLVVAAALVPRTNAIIYCTVPDSLDTCPVATYEDSYCTDQWTGLGAGKIACNGVDGDIGGICLAGDVCTGTFWDGAPLACIWPPDATSSVKRCLQSGTGRSSAYCNDPGSVGCCSIGSPVVANGNTGNCSSLLDPNSQCRFACDAGYALSTTTPLSCTCDAGCLAGTGDPEPGGSTPTCVPYNPRIFDLTACNGLFINVGQTTGAGGIAPFVSRPPWSEACRAQAEMASASFGDCPPDDNIVWLPTTFTPGQSCFHPTNTVGGTYSNAVTFDAQGDSASIFLIRVYGALHVWTSAPMNLAGGARAENIYWLMDGHLFLGQYSQGLNTVGTIITSSTVWVNDNANLHGRVLGTSMSSRIDVAQGTFYVDNTGFDDLHIYPNMSSSAACSLNGTVVPNGDLGGCPTSMPVGTSCQVSCSGVYRPNPAVGNITCSCGNRCAIAGEGTLTTHPESWCIDRSSTAVCTFDSPPIPNGAHGTCTSPMPVGTTCQLACDSGYTQNTDIGALQCACIGDLCLAYGIGTMSVNMSATTSMCQSVYKYSPTATFPFDLTACDGIAVIGSEEQSTHSTVIDIDPRAGSLSIPSYLYAPTGRTSTRTAITSSPALSQACLNRIADVATSAPNQLVCGSSSGSSPGTITPGVTCLTSSFVQFSALTFDANNDPHAVFVVVVTTGQLVITAAVMTLVNAAYSANIFWVVVAGPVTIASSSVFRGTVITASSSVQFGAGAIIDGRVLSSGYLEWGDSVAVWRMTDLVPMQAVSSSSSSGGVAPPSSSGAHVSSSSSSAAQSSSGSASSSVVSSSAAVESDSGLASGGSAATGPLSSSTGSVMAGPVYSSSSGWDMANTFPFNLSACNGIAIHASSGLMVQEASNMLDVDPLAGMASFELLYVEDVLSARTIRAPSYSSTCTAQVSTAYNAAAAASLSCTTIINAAVSPGTVFPGVSCWTGTPVQVPTAGLVFDAQGDPAAVFIIKVSSTLTVDAYAQMTLVGGASAARIFWIVDMLTINDYVAWKGTVLSLWTMQLGVATSIEGRLFLVNPSGELLWASPSVIAMDKPAVLVTSPLAPGGPSGESSSSSTGTPGSSAGYQSSTTSGTASSTGGGSSSTWVYASSSSSSSSSALPSSTTQSSSAPPSSIGSTAVSTGESSSSSSSTEFTQSSSSSGVSSSGSSSSSAVSQFSSSTDPSSSSGGGASSSSTGVEGSSSTEPSSSSSSSSAPPVVTNDCSGPDDAGCCGWSDAFIPHGSFGNCSTVMAPNTQCSIACDDGYVLNTEQLTTCVCDAGCEAGTADPIINHQRCIPKTYVSGGASQAVVTASFEGLAFVDSASMAAGFVRELAAIVDQQQAELTSLVTIASSSSPPGRRLLSVDDGSTTTTTTTSTTTTTTIAVTGISSDGSTTTITATAPLTAAQLLQQFLAVGGSASLDANTFPIFATTTQVLVSVVTDPDALFPYTTEFDFKCNNGTNCGSVGACYNGLCGCVPDEQGYCMRSSLPFDLPNESACASGATLVTPYADACASVYSTVDAIMYEPAYSCASHGMTNLFPKRQFCDSVSARRTVFNGLLGNPYDGGNSTGGLHLFTISTELTWGEMADRAANGLVSLYAYVSNLYDGAAPVTNKAWALVEFRAYYSAINSTVQLTRLVFLDAIEGDRRYYFHNNTWSAYPNSSLPTGSYAYWDDTRVGWECQLNYIYNPSTRACEPGCNNGFIGANCSAPFADVCAVRSFNVNTTLYVGYGCDTAACLPGYFLGSFECVPDITVPAFVPFVQGQPSSSSSTIDAIVIAFGTLAGVLVLGTAFTMVRHRRALNNSRKVASDAEAMRTKRLVIARGRARVRAGNDTRSLSEPRLSLSAVSQSTVAQLRAIRLDG